MKVHEIVTGRSSRFFRVTHPTKGGVPIPMLIEAARQRYGFARVPENLGEILSSRIAIFEQGLFNNRLVKRLAFGDGFFACDVHGTTNEADKLADDIETWALDQLGFVRKDDDIAAKGYASEVEFSLETSASSRLEGLLSIGPALGQFVRSYGNESGDYGLEQIGFTSDPGMFQLLRTIPFVVQRRVGIPFTRDIWYSAAPLRTDDHLGLLDKYAALFE